MKVFYPAAAIAMAAASVSAALASPAAPASAPSAAQVGKKHFIRCIACHAMSATARPMTGPHLEGIVGRPAAALPDFAYSNDMRAQDFVWDEARLDAFLESPHTLHPGMCLTFNGLAKAEDRAALIAYLKNPAP
jgi:cytochrome c